MSSAPVDVPANFTCRREDWQRALTVLEHILHDEDWTKAELGLRQNLLIEHFQAHGVGRTLVLALLDDLLAREVFRAGKSFVDLRTFVRFDGLESGEVIPNRFLHTTRERWFGYLASEESRFPPPHRLAGLPEACRGQPTAASSPSAASTPLVGATPASHTPNLWRREGEVWTLCFAGQSVQLRDRKGLQYLASLIAAKGQLVSVATLANTGGRPLGAVYAGDAVLDAQAMREYRNRYEELQDELDGARRNQDQGRCEKLQAELFALHRHLKAARGLGKRKRKLGDDGERLRKSVQMAITRTLKSIAEKHKALARHVRHSLRLGRQLRYQPEPDVVWDLWLTFAICHAQCGAATRGVAPSLQRRGAGAT
jgi:hypothetical protein